MFSICWVSVLDYLVFMFTCKWGHGNTHLHWKSVRKSQMLPPSCSMAVVCVLTAKRVASRSRMFAVLPCCMARWQTCF